MTAPAARLAVSTTDLLLWLVVLIWGVNFLGVKVVLASMAPLDFTCARFLVMAAIFAAALWWRERSFRVARADLLLLAFVGGVVYPLNQITFALALEKSEVSHTTLFFGTAPLWAAVFSGAMGLERVGPRQWGELFVAFCGAALLMMKEGPGPILDHGLDPGDPFLIACTAAWAFYTVAITPMLRRHSPLKVTTLVTIVGSLAIAAVTLAARGAGAGLRVTDWGAVQGPAWVLFWAIVFIPGVFGWVAWSNGVARIGPRRTMVYQFLIILVGTVTGVVALGERLSPWQIAGALLVVFGVLSARLSRT
ncbi:MAG: EamA family transporter [Planctomycetes bacterium]|nr:EamA family transporter [Planctomycetota bacterium]